MARGAIRQRTNHGDTGITEAEPEASARRPLAYPMPMNLDGHADDAHADVGRVDGRAEPPAARRQAGDIGGSRLRFADRGL